MKLWIGLNWNRTSIPYSQRYTHDHCVHYSVESMLTLLILYSRDVYTTVLYMFMIFNGSIWKLTFSSSHHNVWYIPDRNKKKTLQYMRWDQPLCRIYNPVSNEEKIFTMELNDPSSILSQEPIVSPLFTIYYTVLHLFYNLKWPKSYHLWN